VRCRWSARTDQTTDLSSGALPPSPPCASFTSPFSPAQVDGGSVHLLNRTLFEHNSAPDGKGGSVHLGSVGTVQYTLPAPPGRWLNMRQGLTLLLKPGTAEDLDLPYPCPAGVVGGSSPDEQSGPGCATLW
jgi:hypothetical protein